MKTATFEHQERKFYVSWFFKLFVTPALRNNEIPTDDNPSWMPAEYYSEEIQRLARISWKRRQS